MNNIFNFEFRIIEKEVVHTERVITESLIIPPNVNEPSPS